VQNRAIVSSAAHLNTHKSFTH